MNSEEIMAKLLPKDCPRCSQPLQVLLFLGVQPDFYVCPQCAIAFHLETLEPLATVI
jgi:hypothetical protein